MTKRLQDKVCLLIGGGSSHSDGGASNGQAVALTFAREGAKIAVVDLHLSAANETVEQIKSSGGIAKTYQADASNHADIRRVVADAVSDFGRVDILYNNVGIEYRGGVIDTPEDAWDKVHDVNLKSVFLSCKEVVPLMQKQGGGAIINVSSTASLRWTAQEYISYNTSKAGLNHMTRVMAKQYAPDKIRCNVILPGMINTPHIRTLYKDKSPEELAAILKERDARCPYGRQGTSWEVANAALFLASDEASYVSGVLLPVDGALSC